MNNLLSDEEFDQRWAATIAERAGEYRRHLQLNRLPAHHLQEMKIALDYFEHLLAVRYSRLVRNAAL